MVCIDFRGLLGQRYTFLYTTPSTLQLFDIWFLILRAYVIVVDCTKFHIKQPYGSAPLCERRGWPYAFFAHCITLRPHGTAVLQFDHLQVHRSVLSLKPSIAPKRNAPKRLFNRGSPLTSSQMSPPTP